MVNAEIYRVLFEALCARNVSAIAQAASEILKMPVVVTDAAFIVRAKYPDVPLGDEQWDANVLDRQIEPRFLKTFSEDKHFDHHDRAGKSILTDWGHYASAPRLTTVVRSGDTVLGYFAALTTGATVQPWHFEAADAITEALSVFLDDGFGMPSMQSGFASSTLYSLLAGGAGEGFDHSLLPESFVQENRPPYLLLSVRTENPHNTPLEIYFANDLVKHFEHAVQVVYEDSLYVLGCDIQEDARSSARAQVLADTLARRGLRCGMSRVFGDLSEVYARKWEADSALRVGMASGRDEVLYHYDDYMVDAICEVVISSIPAEARKLDALEHLRLLDEANGTSYLETLKVYYATHFDKKKCCEQMHIHRNTLQYRLDRIAQMEGVDLSNPIYAFYIALSEHERERAASEGADDDA